LSGDRSGGSISRSTENQRLRGVEPSVASSDDHKIALNVRSGSKAKYSERADDFRLTLRTDITKHEPYVGKMPGTDLAQCKEPNISSATNS
jgi:hypothetical protein